MFPKLQQDWGIFLNDYERATKKMKRLLGTYGLEIVSVMTQKDQAHSKSLSALVSEVPIENPKPSEVAPAREKRRVANVQQGQFSSLRQNVVAVINESFIDGAKRFTVHDVCSVLRRKGIALNQGTVSVILQKHVDGIVVAGTQNRGKGSGCGGRSLNVYNVATGRAAVDVKKK